MGSNIQVQKLLNAFFGEEMAKRICCTVCVCECVYERKTFEHALTQTCTHCVSKTCKPDLYTHFYNQIYKQALFLVKKLIMFYVGDKFIVS